MSLETIVTERLELCDASPNERLGQNFLTDETVAKVLAQQATPGNSIIEVGSGVGQITELLAPAASQVVGIEIDRRFMPPLQELQHRYPHLSFIFKDVLSLHLGQIFDPDTEFQIIANLPFHITEPFITRLVDLPIENAVLLLGNNAAAELQEAEGHPGYGRMSLVAQTFFEIDSLMPIGRTSFTPVPRTDAELIRLTPKDRKELRSGSSTTFLLSQLIRRSRKHGLVVNDLKQALVESGQSTKKVLSKQESSQKTRSDFRRIARSWVNEFNSYGEITNLPERDRRIYSQGQAMRVIDSMDIDPGILNQPFFRLDNHQLRELVGALKSHFRE